LAQLDCEGLSERPRAIFRALQLGRIMFTRFEVLIGRERLVYFKAATSSTCDPLSAGYSFGRSVTDILPLAAKGVHLRKHEVTQ
jgi:hypothetical protein